MKATLHWVMWWKHDEPDFIMAGPFVEADDARTKAASMRFHGHRHAQPVSAAIELHDVELLT